MGNSVRKRVAEYSARIPGKYGGNLMFKFPGKLRGNFNSATARVIWKVVSFPIITGLLLLKPVVDFVCGFMVIAGVPAAVAFEISAVGPRFPFLQVMGIFLAFGLFAALYQLLLMFLIED